MIKLHIQCNIRKLRCRIKNIYHYLIHNTKTLQLLPSGRIKSRNILWTNGTAISKDIRILGLLWILILFGNFEKSRACPVHHFNFCHNQFDGVTLGLSKTSNFFHIMSLTVLTTKTSLLNTWEFWICPSRLLVILFA